MKKLFEMLCDMLNGLLTDATTTGLDVDAVQFGVDPTGSEITIMNAMIDVVSPITLGFLLMYFLLELNQKVGFEGRDVTMKTFFAPFLKLVAACLIVSHAGVILSGVIGLGNTWIDDFQSSVTATTEENIGVGLIDLLKEAGGGAKFFTLVFAFFFGVIGWIISKVLQIVWWYKGLLYKIEFIFRVGLAPLAYTDIYNGMSSTAVRYTKGLLAMLIYGASLVFLPTLAANIGLATMEEGIQEMIDATGTANAAGIWDILLGVLQCCIVAPFAAISACSLTKQAAREALGA